MAFDFLKNLAGKNKKGSSEDVNTEEKNTEEGALEEAEALEERPENAESSENPSDAQNQTDLKPNEEEIPQEAAAAFDSIKELDPKIISEFKSRGKEETEEEFTDALNKLLEEDSKIELADVNYDYISDVSVYDTVRNDKEEVLQKIKEENEVKPAEKNALDAAPEKFSPVMLIILIFMALLVAAAVIGFAAAVKVINHREISGDFQGEAISQNKRSVAAANYIYLDNTQPYGDRDLSLIKVLVDSAATVFYFDGEIDMRNAALSLIDDQGNNYSLDLNSLQHSYFEDSTTQIRFEPLNPGINAVKLTVTGMNTGNTAVFDVIFDKPISLPKMSYLKDKSILNYANDDFEVKINYLEYSGSGSRVEYMIENSENNSFDVVQMVKNGGEYIKLSEGTGDKLKLWDEPVFYTFDDDRITLGRMDFKPLDDIMGNTKITINNIYKRYNADLTIPADNISQGQNDEKTNEYEFDNYKVVFEGLKGYDDVYYLVLHCEDKEAQAEADDAYSDRCEVLVDAQLVMNSSNGMQVALDGVCTAESYGTDVAFAVNDMTSDIVRNMPRGNIELIVKNIYVKEEDAVINIEPRFLQYKKPYIRRQFESTIEEAFNSRLEYKAGNADINSVTGFTDEAMGSQSLMSNYKPVEGAKNVSYSVQVTALDTESTDCYAIVAESMEYEKDGKVCYFYRTHKIIAKKAGNYWLIDSDTIIS